MLSSSKREFEDVMREHLEFAYPLENTKDKKHESDWVWQVSHLLSYYTGVSHIFKLTFMPAKGRMAIEHSTIRDQIHS